MATIVLQLDPTCLENPDADLRYALPDLLEQRLPGRLTSDGYDYLQDGGPALLQIFLVGREADELIPLIVKVLATERVLGNDLTRAVLAVREDDVARVVYPHGLVGTTVRCRE